MKIRKFNESEEEQMDLSSDRSNEIRSEIMNLVSLLNEKEELINSISNELNNYKGSSKDKNDQIDDSISDLQLIKDHLNQCVDLLDNVSNNINDYSKNGRKFLY